MERRHALVVKWNLSTDEDIQDDAKAPHVDLGTGVGSGLQQLGRSKVETSAKRLEMAAWGKEVAQTKVDDLDVAGLADEDVLNFEISVDDAVTVAVIQGTGNLTTKLPGLFLLELSVGDDVVKHLAAVDIFEQHVPVIVGSNDIAQTAYIRVAEQGDDGSLSRGADLL